MPVTSAPRRSAVPRLVFVALGVLALLAVVALASRGRIDGSGSRPVDPPRSLIDYGFSIFLVLYALSIPVTIWLYIAQARSSGGQVRGRGRRGGLLMNLAVLFGFIAAAVLLVSMWQSRGGTEPFQLPKPELPQAAKKGPRKAQPQPPHFRWSVPIALVGLAAAGAAVVIVRRRRRPAPGAAALTEELAVALDDAIDDVREETDPRRAVIKAYARLESVLAAHGVPRGAAETPYEYLARTLETLHASATSVARLTDLFERARFSLHEIDSGMRESAIDALAAVRDELREEPQ